MPVSSSDRPGELLFDMGAGLVEVRTRFPVVGEIELPQAAPKIAGVTIQNMQYLNTHRLRWHQIVIWAKYGLMAGPDVSVKRSADGVDCAEPAVRLE